jgi:hypothetical protein
MTFQSELRASLGWNWTDGAVDIAILGTTTAPASA